ncbi:MAG: metallophosphoesterase [Gemmatimonadetes bacterium]|nr:metallophosphoesterase [Gemmatimonadota bacterium]
MTRSSSREHEAQGGRLLRIAAVGDLHFDGAARGTLVDLFSDAARSADVLVLCGDLTTHGRPEQMRAFIEEIAGVEIPIVAVLGNHDYEAEATEELAAMLRDRGAHLLDGDQVRIDGVGFVGTKGFAGGFGRGTLAPFGERLIKDFVQTAIDESLKLENALRTLQAETRVVLMHYSPILDTLKGEPEAIYPFLGSSRLLDPLETHGATVIFHGHAHGGTHEGRTPKGIPVYNVSLPVLRQRGAQYLLWTTSAPERRQLQPEPARKRA